MMASMATMARPLKRSHDHIDDYDWRCEHPTNIYSWTNAFPCQTNNLYAFPEVPAHDLDSVYQSSILAVGQPAYSASSNVRIHLGSETPTFSNQLYGFGPETSQFMFLGDDNQYSHPQVQASSKNVTMFHHFWNQNQHNQTYQSNRPKSNGSPECPSIHGRSVGSAYVIDSSYGQGDALTPGTTQSFDMVERQLEPDYSANDNDGGPSSRENDLFGIGNRSDSPQAGSRNYSASPQGISLDAVEPTTDEPTFTLDEYGAGFQNAFPGPWVPFPSVGNPGAESGYFWDNSFDFMSVPNASNSFPLQQGQTSTSTPMQQNVNLGFKEESQNSREPSHNSVVQTQTSSLKRTSPQPSADGSEAKKKERKEKRGRRKGPLADATRQAAKSTRDVHACWCCKMRKVTCTSDKNIECHECERFWGSHKRTGPFLGKAFCIRTPLEDLEGLFIPDFMVKHWQTSEMDSYFSDFVAENGWLDRGKTDVRVHCGFGPPLVVKGVQKYRPKVIIQEYYWTPSEGAGVVAQTLPLGIPQVGFWEEGDVLTQYEQHLDGIVGNKNDLNGFIDRMTKRSKANRSSQAVRAVLEWYHEWIGAGSMSKEAEALLRNAIKVIMITSIYSKSLTLQEVPQQFVNEAPYPSQNYGRREHCPELISRQVKAALRALQRNLLLKVLKDFGRELSQSEGWPACFAVAIILAFSLEDIEEGSKRMYQFKKEIRKKFQNKSQLGPPTWIHQYRTVALVRVFDILHVLIRCKSNKQTSGSGKRAKRKTSMTSSLLKAMTDLKENLGAEEDAQVQPTPGEEPCRLVSALLELV